MVHLEFKLSQLLKLPNIKITVHYVKSFHGEVALNMTIFLTFKGAVIFAVI